MPCDSVLINTVELGQISNHDLMEKALKATFENVSRYGQQFTFYSDGYQVTLANGRARSEMDRDSLNQVVSDVKRAYGHGAVDAAANEFDFLVEWDGDNFTVQRN